jgi:hypothetical protein
MTKLSRREIEFNRKNRMAVANRLLGWVTFATFLLPRLSDWAVLPLSNGLTDGLRSAFMFCIFLHGIAGIYLYGIPEFKPHPRVFQIYLGFLIVGVFILNRSFIKVPALLTVTEILLWIPILAHVLFGFRYLLHRLLHRRTYPAIPYYLGGAVVRDITKLMSKNN